MLFAYNQTGELVKATESGKKQRFICPDCSEPLICKAGTIKIPHFAHEKNSQCFGLSEGESLMHLNLKEKLWHWGQKFHEDWCLEQPLADLPQRPDLLFNKVCLEVQCSPLPFSRFQERVAGYREKKYHDVWLLGEQLWPKKKLLPTHKMFCSFSVDLGVHFWQIDSQKISLCYHLLKLDQNFYYSAYHFEEGKAPLTQVLMTKSIADPPKLKISVEKINQKKQQLALQLVRQEKNIMELQAFLYQNNLHLLYLPDWLYLPSWYQLFYEEDVLLFRLLWLSFKTPEKTFAAFQAIRQQQGKQWRFPKINQAEILQRLYQESLILWQKF